MIAPGRAYSVARSEGAAPRTLARLPHALVPEFTNQLSSRSHGCARVGKALVLSIRHSDTGGLNGLQEAYVRYDGEDSRMDEWLPVSSVREPWPEEPDGTLVRQTTSSIETARNKKRKRSHSVRLA